MYLHVSVSEDVCTAGMCLWQGSRHTGIKGGDRTVFCCVVVFENWVSPVLCVVLYSTSMVEGLVGMGGVGGLVHEWWCGGLVHLLREDGVCYLEE